MTIRLANRALFLALMLPAISVTGSVPTAGQAPTGLKPQSRRIETFPEVDDLKSVVIFLSHTGGAFSFPCTYSLRITGEEIVEYHGKRGYHLTGPHRDWITGEEVLKLVESFRESDFYSFEDESQMVVMDAGSTAISLTIGNRTSRVVNRTGESHRFKQLAAKIEQLSHAEKWLVGNAETVPSLLADRDNLNLPDDEGGTVLMWACQRTDAAIVRKFLAIGANLHARDRYGRTALTYAVARGMPEAVDVLLQAGADAKESDQDGETPLIYAAGIRDVWFERWFSAPGDSSSSWWPIINLFGDPSPEVIQMLLRAGADPNASDSEGATPLMYAAESFKDGTDILCVLADGGANVNQQDNEGRTALMLAADHYRVDLVRFLIAAKADVHLRDNKVRTALGRLHPPPHSLSKESARYREIRLILEQARAAR